MQAEFLLLVAIVIVLIALWKQPSPKRDIQQIIAERKGLKIAIATMMRKPVDIALWFEHHRNLGICRFYVRVEDTPGLIPFLKMQKDIFYEEGESEKENNYTNQVNRQMKFVNEMMKKAKEEGIDWVFHIDSDELLEGDPEKTLAALPDKIKIGKLKNVEAVYQEEEATCFSAKKFIRCDKGGPCTAYVNGKAVGRTEEGVQCGGAHDFVYNGSTSEEHTAQIAFDDLHVLHYDSCSIGIWLEKFNHMSKKAKLDDIVFGYYHKSIDAAKEAVKVYKNHKMRDDIQEDFVYKRS